MVLAIDISASSAFGSARRTKREFATEIAATLAISAARAVTRWRCCCSPSRWNFISAAQVVAHPPGNAFSRRSIARQPPRVDVESRSAASLDGFLLTDFLCSAMVGERPAKWS
jgi:hypothetical protein